MKVKCFLIDKFLLFFCQTFQPNQGFKYTNTILQINVLEIAKMERRFAAMKRRFVFLSRRFI